MIVAINEHARFIRSIFGGSDGDDVRGPPPTGDERATRITPKIFDAMFSRGRR